MNSDQPAPPPPRRSSVTEVLRRARYGDADAMNRLMTAVYEELHAIAHHKLGFERTGHTLQTTALVHEAYLKLVDQRDVDWQNRAHFYGVAALAMRRILVNYAESRHAAKRGGGVTVVPLDEAQMQGGDVSDEQLLALDEALTRLAQFNERGARVVEYRFFGGLSHEEVAATMGLSIVTVRRAWDSARAWLKRELEANEGN
jgi:RNA polymerase sigma factor (TIGR02999 family)